MSETAHDLLEEVAEGVYIRPMLTLNDAIDVFLASGFKDTTRARYSRVLDTFADRFPRTWDVAKVKESDCLSFLAGYSHRTPGHRGYIEKVLSSFFKHLYLGHQIKQNPMDRIKRTRQPSPEDLDVKTLSSREVVLMLEAAETLSERLCVAVLAYLGPRRRALALLRVKDYDRDRRRLRFHEKGGKTIWKPVPDELAVLLDARLNDSGLQESEALGRRPENGKTTDGSPDDYLIPPEGPLLRAVRDDRVIWRLVKKVAERAGVDAHPHAIRAAFAVYYLETRGRDIVGLQELMGHESSETTKVYLRKMDKALAMEPVRELSWAEAGEPQLLSNGPNNDVFDAPSYVYFVAGQSAMKIGYAGDPLARLRDIQTFHHEELRLLVAVPGGPKLEREYHERFAAYRLRGEWFRLSDELRELVANLEKHPEAIRMQFAGDRYQDSVGVGAGGFEPPEGESRGEKRPISLPTMFEALKAQISELERGVYQ